MVSAPRSVFVSKGATQVRFGDFEYDPLRHELHRGGIRVRIRKQSLAILLKLLESPGSLVTREELRSQLWDSTTFVAFEHGLNSAIKRLRDTLCDSAERPRYIETVPGEGYRFVALVESFPVPTSMPVEVTPAVVLSASCPELPPVHLSTWRWRLGAGIAVAAALVVAFAVWRHWSPPKRGLNFQARDWILITNFENRTGEPVFDRTLEYALERELSNSQYVNVVPRERVDDVLRLMKKPLDTKIDVALGREICLRDGEIPALLTGRVEKLGSTYVLSATVVDTARGMPIASLAEEDPAESQMAAAVRRLSDRVREALGEEHRLIGQSDRRLEKVTTPSWHALQLYTQADQSIRLGSQEVAAELLERALQDDPDFASGHLLLGSVYKQSHKMAEAVPHYERAFKLADLTTDRERFFIRGSYYRELTKEPQKAIEEYETLLQLYPDHFWGANNLCHQYVDLGLAEEAAQLSIRLANLSPTDLAANARAAWAKAIVEQDWNAAQQYSERAAALAALEGDGADPSIATWVKLFPAYENWLKGDMSQAHTQLIEVEHRSKAVDPADLGQFLETFGELREAEKYFQMVPGLDEREDAATVVAFLRGDWPEVRKHLPRTRSFAAPGTAVSMLMVRARMWRDVQRAIRTGSPRRGSRITEGELALAQGDVGKGVSLLEQGLKESLSLPSAAFFLGSESLAQRYQKDGKLDEALRVLQQASQERARTYTGPNSFRTDAAFWMRTELQLADLYREMGRVTDAEKIENELSNLLTYADPDHPILRALQQRRDVRENRGGY